MSNKEINNNNFQVIQLPDAKNKDFKLDGRNVTSLQPNIQDVINNFLLSENFASKRMSLAHEPQQIVPIITFQNRRVLRKGNIMMLASFAGNGKSQFCEAITASFLANRHKIKNVDTLNFDVNVEANKKILYIDTEREADDVFYGMERILRRLGKNNFGKVVNSETEEFKDVIIESFIALGNANLKLKRLIELIMSLKNEIGLLILDGSTDFINDTNSLEQSQQFAQLIIGLANKFDFAVLMTVHTVSRINTKPRGHIGSELSRKCDSMFLLRRHEADEDIKVITTDFDYGKNRSDSDKIETNLKWCNNMKMFVTANESEINHIPTKSEKKDKELKKALINIFENGKIQLSHKELHNKLTEVFEKSEKTIRRYIKTAIEKGLIHKNITSNYTLVKNQSLQNPSIDF